MTGIELPVRVEELRGGNVRLVDAKGETLRPYDIVAILNASPPRAFSSLTLAEFHRMIAEDIADPASMVGDARTLLHRLQAFAALNAAPSWEPLVPGAEYPETFLLCRKDGSSGAVPGGYDKRNPHFYVFDSDGSSWIENVSDWLWMPPPAVPNGPEGGAA